jgi:hypothetical protein
MAASASSSTPTAAVNPGMKTIVDEADVFEVPNELEKLQISLTYLANERNTANSS